MRWAGHVARRMRIYIYFKCECQKEKIQLEIPLCTWECRSKMYLRRKGFGGVDWVRLVRDRNQWRALVNAVTNLRVQ
jgi:hypothetical protein